jgi:hypothetical protein
VDMSASQQAEDEYWDKALAILGIEPFRPR